ncbi:alpha-mannosidase [Lactobacillus nasalidis]|uniref:Alpha-mannosidase n=2 Tax=Lactobacillus nasalidis TaxID=2797258 RepID=A0ABQ3W6P3_9LACO|nr:alpha-mannosidase [Lactobacillus nasalidis]
MVPHTHWDREWFFTSSRAKVYLLKDVQDVLTRLEEDPRFSCFVLDGQASLIVDYLKWRPQDEERVRKLVSQKKLIIGPWYTQTDQFLPSGENIIRNLTYGMRICEKLGGYQKVAYVPDSFGQESSMPQIYREAGLENAVLWRGFSNQEAPKSEFIWQGEDGSRVKVYRMACGYFIGGLIDENNLDKIMQENSFPEVEKEATTNQILFPQGSDMAPIRFNLPDLIEKLNELHTKYCFKISSLEDYISAVNQEKTRFSIIDGEHDSGRDMRVHKSNYSSRADLKQFNTFLQNYLTNVVEPLCSLGTRFGLEYPQAEIESMWEKIFENSAHDSMANCVSDSVNNDILHRYKEVKDIATSIVELTLREISVRVKNDGHDLTLTVFNTLTVSRTGIIRRKLFIPFKKFEIIDPLGNKVPFTVLSLKDETAEINGATIQLNPGDEIYHPDHVYEADLAIKVENIPPMGYKQFYVHEATTSDEIQKSTDRSVENEFYKIELNFDGSLEITDKESNQIYHRQAILEENGDGGDSYNYSPAHDDNVIYSTDQSFTWHAFKSDLVEQLTISFKFKVPKDLNARKEGKLDTDLPVVLKILLYKGEKLVRFHLDVDNREVSDHRLCIDFDSEIVNKFTVADLQFGAIKRPVEKDKDLANWKLEKNKWQEKPISINTMQSFVAVGNDLFTLALFPQGVREYEAIGKNHSKLRLTLFRTYGMLGKSDLLYRPGRASGDATVETPDAELHKELSFDFALYLAERDFDSAEVAQAAKNYNTPLQIFEYAEFLNGRLLFPFNRVARDLPQSASLLSTRGKLILSTIKKADERPGWVIRLYNGGFTAVEDSLLFKQLVKHAELVDLRDECKENLAVEENRVFLPKLEHAKFVSVYIEFA